MRPFVKKLTERRREVNARLAAEDAKHRCGTCRGPLPRSGVKLLWNDKRMFCSEACLPAQGRAS